MASPRANSLIATEDDERGSGGLGEREGFIEKRRHYMENPMPYERPTDFQQFCMTLYEALAFPERAKGFKLPAIFQIRKYQLM